MHKILAFIMMLFVSTSAYASYSDGFFALIILVIATPVMIIGLLITVYYLKKQWFYSRSFTFMYASIWLIISILCVVITSLQSIDGSDKESPYIIFIGVFLYYLIIIIPAVVQCIKNKKRD